MIDSTVAIWIPRKHAKQSYAVESYNVRANPGMAMVKDALQRGGIEVGYCSSATVQEHRIVLVSMTSACDWWPFLAERQRWPKGDYVVIIGGAGCLNVRPFLPWFDAAVFGRAEDLVVALVRGVLAGEQWEHESVCWSSDFNADKIYRIAQADACYPHPVRLSNGKEYSEVAIGCPRKCYFCNYTWTRQHVGGPQSETCRIWTSQELTFWDLDLEHPKTWFSSGMRLLGLDGFTERLRRMVNKPITDTMVRQFVRGYSATGPAMTLRLYSISGLPTETLDDAQAFVALFAAADAEGQATAKPLCVAIHPTPFRAMPCTPAAWWPMSRRDLRAEMRMLRPARDWYLYRGKGADLVLSASIEGPWNVSCDAIVLRGTESETDLCARLARTPKFWAATAAAKQATLEQYAPLDKLMGAFGLANLPTRYLHSCHYDPAWLFELGRKAFAGG